MLDSQRAAKEHARALLEASKAYKQAREDFSARANGTYGSVDQQIRDVQRDADRQRLAAHDIYDSPVGRNFFPGRYQEELKRLAADEEKYIALLKEESAVKKAQASEDLEVRALRAQGKNKEADKLELELRQRREIEEAIRNKMSDEYIARLREVQAIEKTRQALDDLTTSVRNAPSGFKIESYTYRYGTPRGSILPPVTNPFSPERPTGGIPRSVVVQFHGPVTIDARDKTPKQAFAEWSREFGSFAASTVGPNANPAEALGLLPS
jgi:hypothetical protein